MKWIKKGLIFKLNTKNLEMYSHASNPVPIHLHDDIYRIFFSTRNKLNQSSVSYVDIDIIKRKIINNPEKIIHKYGSKGSFYADGISIGDIYSTNNKSFMLFMGWQSEDLDHWRGDIGRFEIGENLKLSLNPSDIYLGIDGEYDKLSLSYPFVLKDGDHYKMWYGSTISWESPNDEMIHTINLAISEDGLNWKRKGIAIEYKLGIAQAFSKPTVVKIDGIYHMWYSYRSGDGTPYRIGYSKSNDGYQWENYFSLSGIDVSRSGWDSEMICYPYVFLHKGNHYLLYNGNNYGKDGFGLAKLNYNNDSI